jgi:DNA-binding response OmpR family regulator
MTIKRILIVDDNEDIRFLMSHLLKSQGYDVKIAENGEAALSQLETTSEDNWPDCILLDWLMPKVDGLTFLTKLQHNNLSLKTTFVIMSGNEINGPVPSIGKKIHHVVKPFDIDRMMNLIKSILHP